MNYSDIIDNSDWQFKIKKAYFGENALSLPPHFSTCCCLFQRTIFGITDRDFRKLANLVKMYDSIQSDDFNCFGKVDSSYYSDITPDYTFPICKLSSYTFSGDTLFDHPDKKDGCHFVL